MLRKLLVALGVMLVGAASADATPFYLGFTGSNASGDVGGAAFSGTQWQLEYLIDPSPSDSSGQPEVGVFTGAIMSGELKLNGTMYEIGRASCRERVSSPV